MEPSLWSSTEEFPSIGEPPEFLAKLFDGESLIASHLKVNLKLRKTTRTGPEAGLTFINQSSQTLEVFWLDPDGTAISYATVAANSEQTLNTYGGHVWRLTTKSGRIVAAFEAADSSATALVDDDLVQAVNADEVLVEERHDSISPDKRWSVFVSSDSLRYRATAQPHVEHPLSPGTPLASFRKDVSRARSIEMQFDKKDYSVSLPELHWAPDSLAFLAIQTESGDDRHVYYVESTPKHRLQPKLRSYPYLKPGDRIPTPILHLFVWRTDIPPSISPTHNSFTSRAASSSPSPVPKNAPPRIDTDGGFFEVTVSSDLFPHPFELENFQWRSDSKAIRFSYIRRGHQLVRVLEIDLTGRVRVLVDEPCKTFFCFNKFHLQYLGDDEILWMSERSGWNHLYLYKCRNPGFAEPPGTDKGEKVEAASNWRPITSGRWAVQQVLRVSESKRLLWFLAHGLQADQDPYFSHLALTSLDAQTPEKPEESRTSGDGTPPQGFRQLTEGNGTHHISWLPAGLPYFLDKWSRCDLPPVLEIRSSFTGQLVYRFPRPDAATPVRCPQAFSAPGRDGDTPIYGLIHWPTDFDPSRRYPVLECVYSGPDGFHVPKAWSKTRSQQPMCDRGFIVVQIDGMGTSGRSKAFHDVCWQNLSDHGFPDRLAWLRALPFPQCDLSRLGIYGGSAGGQASPTENRTQVPRFRVLCANPYTMGDDQNVVAGTNSPIYPGSAHTSALAALLFHSGYRCAVADCGCHDNRLDKLWWGEQWLGWPVGPAYAAASNVVHAARLDKPLMLVVGETDRNVDPASTMQLAHALVEANKPFELLVMPGSSSTDAEVWATVQRRLPTPLKSAWISFVETSCDLVPSLPPVVHRQELATMSDQNEFVAVISTKGTLAKSTI